MEKRLENYIKKQEHKVDIKSLIKEYNENKSFKTNTIKDIEKEIKERGYYAVAEKYNVPLDYLIDTFKPKRQRSKRLIYTLTDKHKKDIQLMVNSGYKKIFIRDSLYYDTNQRIDKDVLEEYINEYTSRKVFKGHRNIIRNDFEI